MRHVLLGHLGQHSIVRPVTGCVCQVCFPSSVPYVQRVTGEGFPLPRLPWCQRLGEQKPLKAVVVRKHNDRVPRPLQVIFPVLARHYDCQHFLVPNLIIALDGRHRARPKCHRVLILYHLLAWSQCLLGRLWAGLVHRLGQDSRDCKTCEISF